MPLPIRNPQSMASMMAEMTLMRFLVRFYRARAARPEGEDRPRAIAPADCAISNSPDPTRSDRRRFPFQGDPEKTRGLGNGTKAIFPHVSPARSILSASL